MAFEPRATSFSMANAQILAQASTVAYDSPERCATWAKVSGFTGAFDFFDHQDTQGFVAESADAIIVAFRGTQPNRPMDWFVDFRATSDPWDHNVGKVHAGFYSALRKVWGVPLANGEVLPKRLVNRGSKPIWVTGHSLGGGLATLMAAEILRREDAGENFDLRGVYTYGSPRVGNKAFRAKLMESAAKHGAQLVRFRNGDDVVTAVPRMTEFEHVGKVAHLREDKLEVGDADPPYGGMGSFADHDIAGFVKPKKAVSGYYRRVLAASKLKPSKCATAAVAPPAPVVVKPPLAAGTKLACDRMLDPAAFTKALGESAPLTVRDLKTDPDAAASCSLIRGGKKPSVAEQQKLLKQTGRLGVLPGDSVCEISAYCWTIEDPDRFAKKCGERGHKLDGKHCIESVPVGANDQDIIRFVDDDTRCVLAVRGGPANTDNDQVRACAKLAAESFGPAQLTAP